MIAKKFDLDFDEILKISAPSDEVEKQQQCHVVIRDYQNLTELDLNQLLSGNGTSDNGETLAECNSWKYDRSKHGFLLAERVSSILLYNFTRDKIYLLCEFLFQSVSVRIDLYSYFNVKTSFFELNESKRTLNHLESLKR